MVSMMNALRATCICLLSMTFTWGCGDSPSTAEPVSETPTDNSDDLQGGGDTAWALPELTGPAVLEDLNSDPNVVEVELQADYSTELLADDFAVELMTYNGGFPGPTLQAKVGDEVIVHFTNRLDQPTTVHWHGLRVSDEMDGNPRIQNPVQPGESFTYQFIVPEAGTFWYHPHVRANEQVERGLYGAIVVHDPDDPVFDVERVIVLDDILLDGDQVASFGIGHMEQMNGRLGNSLLANGWGGDLLVDAVEGHVERWRLINTSNARTLVVSLDGAGYRVVGTDGGRLAEPYAPDAMLLAVGQRYDLEVSYPTAAPAQLNVHVTTLNEQNETEQVAIPVYQVQPVATGVRPTLPEWRQYEPLIREDRPIDREESIVVSARNAADGSIEWLLNGQAHGTDGPLFTFAEGETVKFNIVNDLGPEHPFHLHGQFFEIVNAGDVWTNQPGLKDTVLIPGGSNIEVIAYMDNPGRWMAHCHILEHAELGMMSEIVVTPAE